MHSYAAFLTSCLVVGCASSAAPEAAAASGEPSGAGGTATTSTASTSAHTSTSADASPASSGAGGAGGARDGVGGAGFDCLPQTGFGGDGDGGACASPHYATRVVEACIGPNGGYGLDGFPSVVLGPPKGGGANQGSTDVLGLGEGGSIVLAFDGGGIVDGPGPDFIVFENPFIVGGNPDAVYANPGTVSVSEDGVTWASFPCTATEFPWGSCAGWHPVYANSSDNSIDPLDPAKAGGDAFDLADLGVAHARFVRITDRADLPGDFDLDAVAVVNAGCP